MRCSCERMLTSTAAAAGVEVELRKGEASALPFEDASMDAVLTVSPSSLCDPYALSGTH